MPVRIEQMTNAADFGFFGGMGMVPWHEKLERALIERHTANYQKLGYDMVDVPALTTYSANRGSGQWSPSVKHEAVVKLAQAEELLDEAQQAERCGVFIAPIMDTPGFGTMSRDKADPYYAFSVAHALEANLNRFSIIYVELNPSVERMEAEQVYKDSVGLLRASGLDVKDLAHVERYAAQQGIAAVRLANESDDERRQRLVDLLVERLPADAERVAAARAKAQADHAKSVAMRKEFVEYIQSLNRSDIYLVEQLDANRRDAVMEGLIPEMALQMHAIVGLRKASARAAQMSREYIREAGRGVEALEADYGAYCVGLKGRAQAQEPDDGYAAARA